ncbi:hypothetical protein [Pseudidiomarina sp.]|uniref:hypothetical protein n=1 Tax=Pseudidiomarina sp. TaxID=2081707 RepID=UPI00299D3524|nr:hypothetical protein [Pseudidiomarina sp.]MDX1705666.1 hypothetical protein [Pseudidiomarina sp.]
MLSSKLAGPWSRGQGFVILISFVVIYFGLSWLSMLAVKYTIGFAEFWGDSKYPPAMLLTLSQLLKALVILAVIWPLALKRYQVSWTALGFCRARLGGLRGSADSAFRHQRAAPHPLSAHDGADHPSGRGDFLPRLLVSVDGQPAPFVVSRAD